MKIRHVMENLINICQTCLSGDRQLLFTSRIRTILREINYEELENNKSICWECHSIVMKFYRFRMQVKNIQIAWNKKLHKQKTFSRLLCITKCNYDFEFTHNYSDPLTNVPILDEKPETKCIKQEIFIQNTDDFQIDYSESEDEKKLQVFVDNLKNKKDKTMPKQKRKQNKKKIKQVDHAELKKFETVSLTEEEMLRCREEKKNQPNYKKIPFKCDSCVLGFTTKENFDVHFEKKHDKTAGAHICNVCSTRFSSQSSLHRHRSKHYLYHSCCLCDYKTSAVKAAINHCRDKHALDERDRIHCKQCEAVLRTPAELAEHTRTKHTLYCNDCGEKFKGKHTLRTHQLRIHAVKREFVCDTCTKSFLTKSRLESHMIKHSQTLARRLAYCALCRVQYKDIHVYRNHVRNSVRHSLSRYQCPECNKKFASKVYLTKHYNFYHLKKSQYKCEACDKLFISEWRLKNHRQKHHGLSRSRDHTCNECGKKFYTVSTLRGHQLTHSTARSYMCEECGDTFKQRPALYTHARLVHAGPGNNASQ